MRTISMLVLICSLPAGAQDAQLDPDLKLIGKAIELHILSIPVESGSVVPFRGQCIEEGEFVRREKINVRNQIIAAEAQDNFLISTPVLIAIVAGVAAASAGVAIGITYAATRK